MRPLVAGSATAIRLIKLSFFLNNGMCSAAQAGCSTLHEENREEMREMIIGIAVGILVGIIWMIAKKKRKIKM